MKILITLLVLFFSNFVFAEWILISEDEDNNYSIDYNTIIKERGFAEFWNMENYVDGLGDDTKIMSSINLLRTDCNSKRIKYLYSFLFSNKNGKGEIFHTILIPDDSWTTFNRTSHFGKMHSEVCD